MHQEQLALKTRDLIGQILTQVILKYSQSNEPLYSPFVITELKEQLIWLICNGNSNNSHRETPLPNAPGWDKIMGRGEPGGGKERAKA